MATRYTCTINVRCWKQHTCVACGGQFSYLFLRKVTGTAGSPAASQATAGRNVKKRMDSDVDSQPCPACGIYQPDMIGQRRNTLQVLLVCPLGGGYGRALSAEHVARRARRRVRAQRRHHAGGDRTIAILHRRAASQRQPRCQPATGAGRHAARRAPPGRRRPGRRPWKKCGGPKLRSCGLPRTPCAS